MIGKCIGVFSFTWLMVRTRLAHLPQHANWQHIFGVSIKGISHLIINSEQYNIEESLLVSLEKSVEELDDVIKSVAERTAV
ncbi:Na+/H+ antiporter NhaA [Filimonas lacunae]|uniref:Na+/H+ antiporter NhaA n=1 Tax=Filimonas lacunae TaxID=477680 RepID=UPI00097118D5|nr:Na+/H+ antiporter NhaA [Filimonas lacunae]